MIKKCLSLAVIACLTGQVAIASGKETYSCRFEGYGTAAERSYIPEVVRLVLNSAEKSVLVGVSFKGPVKGKLWPAEVSGFGKKKTIVRWRFNNVETKGSTELSLDYTLRLHNGNKTVTVRAWPRGYDDDIRGKGSCQLIS
ncbi:hypothetical protein RSK20926_21574 [Roseobacter sp. SK209-2-6]|uniref:hypothetical protein n=1 Tax=Roseobacter sp. SK209-2-6 TaxID=388739 RepID=UPI0000F3F24C|nr:hypothetical protein [Roseobacter sp. SK209-2-6]EBA16358.1 hypothetical protein RSK20926_21574 [Roseobacter sp. SK209-2-6]